MRVACSEKTMVELWVGWRDEMKAENWVDTMAETMDVMMVDWKVGHSVDTTAVH